MTKAMIHAGRGLLASTVIAVALMAPATASAQAEQEKFLSLMSQYLALGNAVVDTAERPEATIFLAIEGIFEVYEKRRDVTSAVSHFQRLLKDYGDNQTVRNLIRFKLRDIYKETGQTDKALEQLELIIAENAALER